MEHNEDQSEDEFYSAGSAYVRVVDAEAVMAMSAERRQAQSKEAEALPEVMGRLRTLLQTYYPPHLIAVLAGWGLRTSVGPEGVGNRPMIKGMSQHHVELLQAIALSLPSWEWGEEPAGMSDIQETIDALLALPDAFVAVRRNRAESISDPSAATVLSLQERLRMHTQMVRNWGGYRSMLEVLRKQYAPLDPALRERQGFGALDVIAVIENTVASIEGQIGERFRLLKEIFRAGSISELVREFFLRFPGVAGDPKRYLAELDADASLESVRAHLLSHADRWLVVNAIAPVAQVAEASGLSEALTREILDLLSMSGGALSEHNPDHFFLSNPVWTKPGIKTRDQYFFAFPQTAVSFLHQILPPLFVDNGLSSRLKKRRSSFLEQETRRIIEVALPGAEIMPEAKWSWQDRDYETDVLVVLDRTILILECKSASLTPQGLRGAPERVRRHVGELIAEPAIQSARLAKVINIARAGDPVAIGVARGLGIEPAEISEIIRVSVTLDDLTILSSAEVELRAANWIPNELDLPTTLNIADLACVADILDRPSFFLDYFKRRSQLQKSADVIGFELDFLGLYLATNFDVGPTDGHLLVIAEMSGQIDRYYQNVEIGHQSDKPTANLHPYFDALLSHLEVRKPRGWTKMAMDLLSVGDLQAQTDCANALEALRLDVSRVDTVLDRLNGFFILPNQESDVVIVFHAFTHADRSAREEEIRRLAGYALAESSRLRCLFLSRMIETWDVAPYDAIGVLKTVNS